MSRGRTTDDHRQSCKPTKERLEQASASMRSGGIFAHAHLSHVRSAQVWAEA